MLVVAIVVVDSYLHLVIATSKLDDGCLVMTRFFSLLLRRPLLLLIVDTILLCFDQGVVFLRLDHLFAATLSLVWGLLGLLMTRLLLHAYS